MVISSYAQLKFMFIVDEEERQAAIAITIRLYNKARMLSVLSLLEVKTYLKTAAAWMLTAYGVSKFKAVVSCIRLHCRSAAELILHFERDQTAALHCLEQAIANWTQINNQALERLASSADVEELRLYIFHAYLALGRLLLKGKSVSVKDVTASVTGAMEILQHLPSLRFQFAEHAVYVGYQLATLDYMAESVGFFLKAIAVLELLSEISNGHLDCEVETNKMDREKLKGKACLSLSYVYTELK